MEYKGQEWRSKNEEKRALERLQFYDIEKLRKMGEAFTSKMEAVNGRTYEVETAGEFYPAGKLKLRAI